MALKFICKKKEILWKMQFKKIKARHIISHRNWELHCGRLHRPMKWEHKVHIGILEFFKINANLLNGNIAQGTEEDN